MVGEGGGQKNTGQIPGIVIQWQINTTYTPHSESRR
ncbi:hypothetical protein PC1_3441 [Pectobacterium carotovorum subsp. carotovorum PC1]|uniref:Uncharacterized protein n=1 Tax=Pectobacterium carotovorum subsp. carotovorum (strain PC1) TaxID=561230 RepID=C6DE21_PECCP|nr:hypothetical protein PC1_3441 [Pectobacterium carotovorum subsp. carotovorum PC1]